MRVTWDKVSTRRLKHYLDAQKLLRPDAWLRLMNEVNAGVFPGAGEAEQGDAFNLLYSRQADVVYFDPPYLGTTCYEREYAVLPELLEGQTRPVSGFSRSADLLPELFKASARLYLAGLTLQRRAELNRARGAHPRPSSPST